MPREYTVFVPIRVTQEQADKMKRLAIEGGYRSVAAYIRAKCAGERVVK
jgi:Arc/MetJ-type ribon-helix-helix transcriptional regulator